MNIARLAGFGVAVPFAVQLAACTASQESALPASLAAFGPNGAPRNIAAQLRPLPHEPCCVYVSETFASSLLEYNYLGTQYPICTVGGLKYAESLQSDAKGELIVSTGSGVNVYQESRRHRCLPSSPTKQIPFHLVQDAFSLDGRTYYITGYGSSSDQAQVNVYRFGRNPGFKRPLRNAAVATPAFVTADASGVYAAGYDNHTSQPHLVYWKAGRGAGAVLSGYVNRTAGGIFFDGFGDLLAIDATYGADALYVYTGCPYGCTAHGPFPISTYGVVYSGSLNAGETRFMSVSSSGSIDVFQYNGIYGVSYLYSNGAGLTASLDPWGIAQNQ